MSEDLATFDACPDLECDSTSINLLTARRNQVDEDTPRYRCRDCNNHFNDPRTHAPKNTTHGLSGSQKELWEADPDEFDLRADGGVTTCSDYGGVLEHRSGCETCLECGYSKRGGGVR